MTVEQMAKEIESELRSAGAWSAQCLRDEIDCLQSGMATVDEPELHFAALQMCLQSFNKE